MAVVAKATLSGKQDAPGTYNTPEYVNADQHVVTWMKTNCGIDIEADSSSDTSAPTS
jgi:hypothetical protein